MEEATLIIRGATIQVKKEVLCQHSDYFRAMFSGNYVEGTQKEISIDILEPNIMTLLIQYMNDGLIDLSKYSLCLISQIAIAANFLQITDLMKQIECTLNKQLCEKNCVELMSMAENFSFSKLEQLSAAFGLFSFKSMKPEYIPTIHKLIWYLSHPHLYTQSELDVFHFGRQWILNNKTNADAILIILGCLDIKRLSHQDIKEIKKSVKKIKSTMASKVIDCFYAISKERCEISDTTLNSKKKSLCDKFTERVWTEAADIVRESKSRIVNYTLVAPMWDIRSSRPNLPQYMYTINHDKDIEIWLDLTANKVEGWSVISWGLTKLVFACGEYTKSSGCFMKDIIVYDTLKEEWMCHGVDLPSRSHAGLAIVGDSLYIVGGVDVSEDVCRVLKTAIVYDLNQRTYCKIAEIPEGMYPTACTHGDVVYVAVNEKIYRYEQSGKSGFWKTVMINEDIERFRCITSCKKYIYCIENNNTDLYRFEPNVDMKLQIITQFPNPPNALLNVDNRLLAITDSDFMEPDILTVEELEDENEKTTLKIVCKKTNNYLRIVAGSGMFAVVITLPPLCPEPTQYQNRYLKKYKFD